MCHRLEGRQLIAFGEPLQPSPLFLALVLAEEILIYLFFLKDTADGNMSKASLFRESTPTELALYFLDLLGDLETSQLLSNLDGFRPTGVNNYSFRGFGVVVRDMTAYFGENCFLNTGLIVLQGLFGFVGLFGLRLCHFQA